MAGHVSQQQLHPPMCSNVVGIVLRRFVAEVDPMQLGVLEASGRVVKDWLAFVVERAGAN